MDSSTLQLLLSGLPLAQVVWHDSTASTNDDALACLRHGSGDGCLVAADSQTSGRGRLERKWVTRPEAALAFSLVCIPSAEERNCLGRFALLGPLAVSTALEQLGLKPQIKWPNDVLLDGRKVCGMLLEADWLADELRGLVIGIGINVAPAALPPAEELRFPATCIEDAAGHPVDRFDLLRSVLAGFFSLRHDLCTESILVAWQQRMAYMGAQVRVNQPSGEVTGIVLGVDSQGGLLLRNSGGNILTILAGDVQLRPVL
jgi:BirA family biotin operon repressor/biotin-[acetyl-CoA-carboxylase] ligase